VRVPAWSCGFLSLLLNCFHQLARSRLDWTASLWFGRAGLGPPAMACAVDGLLVAIAEGVSGDDVRYVVAGWSIGGCDVRTSRYLCGEATRTRRRRRWCCTVVRRRGRSVVAAAAFAWMVARGDGVHGTRGCLVMRARLDEEARSVGGFAWVQSVCRRSLDRRRCRSRGSL